MSRESQPDFVTARPLDEVGTQFLKAAAYLRKHGHCKREVQDGAGRVCLLGALISARGRVDEAEAERAGRDDLEVFASRIGHSSAGSAIKWNNADERTGDEVIAALESAAWSAP